MLPAIINKKLNIVYLQLPQSQNNYRIWLFGVFYLSLSLFDDDVIVNVLWNCVQMINYVELIHFLVNFKLFHFKKLNRICTKCFCEFNLVCRDIVYYMQRSGFEPQTPHFFTFKMCKLQQLSYLKKKKKKNMHKIVYGPNFII